VEDFVELKRKYETANASSTNDNIKLAELRLSLEKGKSELYEMQLGFNTIQQDLKEKIQVSKGELKVQEKQISDHKLEIENLQEKNKLVNNELLEVKHHLSDSEKKSKSDQE
jgi:hypothetical protein